MLSYSSKELLIKICTDFCSLATYRTPTYQQRFGQAYIFNFFQGNYSYSLNNYNEIFKFILTNTKEEWELYDLPLIEKKKPKTPPKIEDISALQKPSKTRILTSSGFVWRDVRIVELQLKIDRTPEETTELNLLRKAEQRHRQVKINTITGDEMYDAIPQSRSVVKKGSRKHLGKAKSSAPVFQWYKHKSSNNECNYCGIFLTDHNRSRDHVHPIIQGGKHKGNLVWCCKQCNELKGGNSLEEWLVLLKQKLPSLKENKPLTTYYSRLIESVTYMIKMKEDTDLINDPVNKKAAAIDKHVYAAINKKKRRKNGATF